MISVREEAELLDISQTQVGGAEAWMVALHLACAGRDSDLAALDVHESCGDSGTVVSALCAPCHALFRRAGDQDSQRSFLCANYRGIRCATIWKGRASACSRPARLKPLIPSTISRFACLARFAPNATGFHHGQNVAPQEGGDTCQRLALGMDALVDRETLAMELWPHAEFNSARNNLYSTISRLRSALGPTPDGKSCVLIKMNALDSTATTSRPMCGCLTR